MKKLLILVLVIGSAFGALWFGMAKRRNARSEQVLSAANDSAFVVDLTAAYGQFLKSVHQRVYADHANGFSMGKYLVEDADLVKGTGVARVFAGRMVACSVVYDSSDTGPYVIITDGRVGVAVYGSAEKAPAFFPGEITRRGAAIFYVR